MLKRLTLIGLLLGATGAQANILVSLAHEPTLNLSGTYDYVYDLKLQPSALAQPGSFVTLYDFAGLGAVSDASFAAIDLPGDQTWSVMTSLTGVTPTFIKPRTGDSPFLKNVTVALLSGDNIVPDSSKGSVLLGQLTLTSLYGDSIPKGGSYASNTLRQGPGGTALSFTGLDTTPVPEPGTVGLLSFGLLGVAAVAMRRRSKS
ncbi:MAG: PEP-CTERM sorting domain-containing protein [Betaproteobacteria bacterium]